MSRGGFEGILKKLPEPIRRIFGWGRSFSVWAVHYVTGCCSPEFMQVFGPRYDMERWGFLSAPATRQSDALVFVGNVTRKMMRRALRIYEQMPEPRFVVNIGICPISKGPFYDSYSLVRVSDYLPVDVHIPGCPPKPEAILHGMLLLRKKILSGKEAGNSGRGGEAGGRD
jgi:NADH-quinone oxidoreductase subunit B